MKHRPWRKAVYWLWSHDLLSLLSHTTPDHLPRGGTIPSGPGPSPGQSDWGIFSVEVPLSHMTIGHCRNPKTQHHSGQQQDEQFLRTFPQNRRKVFPVVGHPTHTSCAALNKLFILSGFSYASMEWEKSLLLSIVVLEKRVHIPRVPSFYSFKSPSQYLSQ